MRAPLNKGLILGGRGGVAAEQTLEGLALGALIMLGTLFGLIVLIFALVLRYDPEARG
jgi:hypothetical protein